MSLRAFKRAHPADYPFVFHKELRTEHKRRQAAESAGKTVAVVLYYVVPTPEPEDDLERFAVYRIDHSCDRIDEVAFGLTDYDLACQRAREAAPEGPAS